MNSKYRYLKYYDPSLRVLNHIQLRDLTKNASHPYIAIK